MDIFHSKSFYVVVGIYLLLVLCTIGGMLHLRQKVLEQLSTPATKTDVETWNAFTHNQTTTNEQGEERHKPVLRAKSALAEPPALILLRDHFAIALFTLLLLGSAVFGTIALLLQGVLKSGRGAE